MDVGRIAKPGEGALKGGLVLTVCILRHSAAKLGDVMQWLAY